MRWEAFKFWDLVCLILETLRYIKWENMFMFPHRNQHLKGLKVTFDWQPFSACKYTWDFFRWVNSLAPGRFQINFRQVIFMLTLVNCGWGISHEIALRWMPLDLTGDKSTLIQVMAWCRQATSHYLNRCWLRSISPNGITRPQWGPDKMPAILQITFSNDFFM